MYTDLLSNMCKMYGLRVPKLVDKTSACLFMGCAATFIGTDVLASLLLNRYESIIATLCESLDTLDEPEAKVLFLTMDICAAVFWFPIKAWWLVLI